MPTVIARRRIYNTPAGGSMRVTQEEATVLKLLALADDPPSEPLASERPRRTYKRRDLMAEVAEPMAGPVVEEPAAKIVATMPKWVGK